MPSLVPGYEYDVFISYRQNDNRSGWVTQFVEHLREELAATIKEPVNIYFDENPHDGLQDTHHVDKSLKNKLRCLIFIPILSHTYCDPKSFAWSNEFLPFCTLAKQDDVGMDVRLPNGNVTSRILSLQIHELDPDDQKLFEQQAGSQLRSIEFIFRSHGVNRPLTPDDSRVDNLSKIYFRDQINKTANAIKAILSSVVEVQPKEVSKLEIQPEPRDEGRGLAWFWKEFRQRNVGRAGITYIIVSLLLVQILAAVTPVLQIEERFIVLFTRVLVFGFPVAMLLAWSFEISPHGLIRTTSEQAVNNPYPPSRKKPLTSVSMVFVLMISIGLLALYTQLILRTGDGFSLNKPVFIAVLPFENKSVESKDQYLADAITDDIITRLSTLHQLRVTNRKSTQEYKGELASAYDVIASELKVQSLLLGSLQRIGDQVIVRAQLIDGATNTFIWANTYHRTTRNYINIHTNIAEAVASHLNIELTDEERAQLTRQATSNDTAYYRYLVGRNLYYKYKRTSNDSAVSQFKLAIQADPTYSLAWAGLGDAYSQTFVFGGPPAWLDSAMTAGKRCIELDSTLSEGYKALANAYSYKKLYDKAFPLLKKAVELSPSNAQAVGNLGTAYFLRTEFVEALAFQKRSAGLTPKNWIPYQLIGWTYALLGDQDRAVESFNKSLELNPYGQTYELLAYTLVSMGHKRDAIRLIPRLLELGKDDFKVLERAGLISHFSGEDKTAREYFQKSIENNKNFKTDVSTVAPISLGQILLEEGKRVEADVLLSHAMETNLNEIARGSQDDDPPFRIAGIYAIRGQKEEMLQWLNKAIQARWVDCNQVLFGPWFAKYQSDPDLLKVIEPVRRRLAEMRKQVN